MNASPSPDSIAAVVAELRERAEQLQVLTPGLSVEWKEWADRLERLDAEMRKKSEHASRAYVDLVNAELRLSDENKVLRAKLSACESALQHYVEDKWAPVADYSLMYWYQRGKAPWKHAEKALASRTAPDPGPIHPWDAVGVVRQEEPPR